MQYYTQQTQNLVETTYNLYVNAHGKRRLTDDFTPGPFDVICARGKAAQHSEGNTKFRALVAEHAEHYGQCTCKYEKSKIVSHIVNTVRKAAAYHKGGFVKQIDGHCWYEVGDRAAKEKIGQTFRDLLHTKYSSSTKAKARARIQKRLEGQEGQEGQDDDDAVEDFEEAAARAERESGEQEKQPATQHPTTLPIPFPTLQNFNFLRHSNNNSSILNMTMMNNLNPLNNNHHGKNKRSSVRLSLVSPHNSSTTINSSKPFEPFSDQSLLDTLRSSIQTVDVPPPPPPPRHHHHPGQALTESQASHDWRTDSVLSNMSVVLESSTRRRSTTVTPPPPPLMEDSSRSGNRYDTTTTTRTLDEDLVGTTLQYSVEPAPYGIFSSSSRSHPFLHDSLNSTTVSNSITSTNNPLLVSSTRDSFMNMDMVGLLDSMDSMGFDNMAMEL